MNILAKFVAFTQLASIASMNLRVRFTIWHASLSSAQEMVVLSSKAQLIFRGDWGFVVDEGGVQKWVKDAVE